MSESVAEIDFHQKNSLFTMSFFANPGWVKWHRLTQTKSKNKHHFSIPIFWVIQLYFLVLKLLKDSSTPKILKIPFVSGWSVNKEQDGAIPSIERMFFNRQEGTKSGHKQLLNHKLLVPYGFLKNEKINTSKLVNWIYKSVIVNKSIIFRQNFPKNCQKCKVTKQF